MAIRNDEELGKLLAGVTIARGGGVLPNINPVCFCQRGMKTLLPVLPSLLQRPRKSPKKAVEKTTAFALLTLERLLFCPKRIYAINREFPPPNEQFILDSEQLQSQFRTMSNYILWRKLFLCHLVAPCSGHRSQSDFLRSLSAFGDAVNSIQPAISQQSRFHLQKPQHQIKEQNALVMNKKIRSIMAERQATILEIELEAAMSEKNEALAARDVALRQRDEALAQRDNALLEWDNAPCSPTMSE
ncbi:hypothetical protein KIW84_064529 [Lathyrus oleraceus]|uniref:GAGA-binding transcriptional activator n=1 Tax=Pisum sativum TaxID=3888 RepID=A0A9D4WAG2_PEA|nr:hypothetical protein KIW84_064529 [Pisum sativum]